MEKLKKKLSSSGNKFTSVTLVTERSRKFLKRIRSMARRNRQSQGEAPLSFYIKLDGQKYYLGDDETNAREFLTWAKEHLQMT